MLGYLEAMLVDLGIILGHIRAFWAIGDRCVHLEAILGLSWVLVHLRASLGHLWTIQHHLGGSWGHLGASYMQKCNDRSAFNL